MAYTNIQDVAGTRKGSITNNTNIITASDLSTLRQRIDAKIHNSSKFFEGVRNASESDSAAISRIVGDADVDGGSILVIKTLIVSGTVDKYEYKAFVFDTSLATPAWVAMSGNYDWESVIAGCDITVTKAVGTIVIPSSGSATFATAGKNIKQVFEKLLAQEQYPTVTHPSVSLTSKKGGTAYTSDQTVEAGTSVTFSYTTSLNSGSYTYGPATGVTAQSYSVALKKGSTAVETKTASSDTFTAVTVNDSEVYTIESTISHNAGATPLTNLGSDATTEIEGCEGTRISGSGTGSSNPISATTKSATGKKVTGYRNGVFFGGITTGKYTASELAADGSLVRSLLSVNNVSGYSTYGVSTKNNAGTVPSTFKFVAPKDTYTIVIAAKGTKQLNGAFNDSVFAEMKDLFKQDTTTVTIPGAGSDTGTSYTIWTYSPVDKYSAEVKMSITLG